MDRFAVAIALALLSACSGQRLDAVTRVDDSPGNHANGHFQMEKLSRGVVAISVDAGVYVGWRMLGYEYDPEDPDSISYNVYRNGAKVANVADSTNYLDPGGRAGSSYSVRAVKDGVEGPDSGRATVWSDNYLRVGLDPPAAGMTPSSANCDASGEGYTYDANDTSVGDLDGDGEYEIVLKWMPTNAKGIGQSGCTGNVYLDAYELSGTKLWRIDLGVNIRAGLQYTQFVVYDLDGDGKAEVALKTAPGTRDGTGTFLHKGPAASDDDSADYRSVVSTTGATGYILDGPEYLTVFAGTDGAELASVAFDVARGDPASWGDDNSDSVDLFLASVGFISDLGQGQASSGRPSLLWGRGFLGRTAVTAWSWRDGQLVEIWRADSDAGTAYSAQASGSMMVADVDADGAQEIVLGSSTLDSDGTRKCSTDLGPGDSLSVADLLPDRPGLEVFTTHSLVAGPAFDVHDANTCEVTFSLADAPPGTRGVADDIVPTSDGAEILINTLPGIASIATRSLISSQRAPAPGFVIYWDGDESRELENGVSIAKYTGDVLETCSECASNNGIRANPALVADLLGDWREEIIWREPGNTALRLYTTTALTSRRLFTLMHDPQYRAQVSAEQAGYNQPPHTGFHLGSGMLDPPKPDIHVR